MYKEEFDDLEKFEREDTKKVLPLGWLILFLGLIVFGVLYLYMYTPAFTGWTQNKSIEEIINK